MDATELSSDHFWEADSARFLAAPGAALPEVSDAPALVYFQTSGSTGRPKWIGLSRAALLESARQVNLRLEVTASSRWALTLPTYHVGGFGVVARSYLAGCAFSRFDGKWNAAAFTAWAEKEGITHLSLVPTQVHDLVAAGFAAPRSLKAIVVGGGRLAVATGQAARDLGWPVLPSYGMTEACSQIATAKLDSLTNPYADAPLPVLDHWQVRTTSEGVFEIAGPSLFSGMIVAEEDGWKYVPRNYDWYRTSDYGRVTDDGLIPMGRMDQVVKVLGELVDPLQVEAQLMELALARGASTDFVVLALPDERAGHLLHLVHDMTVSRAQIDELVTSWHAKCPGYLRVKTKPIAFEIPRSPLGKVLRADLQKMLTQS
jgi:o-succinylbenzoate---CoA ligase